MLTVLSVFGTRPEAIKMAPVLRELARHPGQVRSLVCVTGQHRQMLDQATGLFGIRADYDLNVMQDDQGLAQLTARLFSSLDPVVQRTSPDWILAQGDTTTVLVAALVAYYQRVKFGHVEAGLRTGDRYQPYPEEINRVVADSVAELLFTPTEHSKGVLLAQGHPASRIVVTGNTVVDALLQIAEAPYDWDAGPLAGVPREGPLVLVTAHRRESFGAAFRAMCLAIRDLAERFRGEGAHFVFPVHLNPNVRQDVGQILSGVENVMLLEPLDYGSLVHLMKRATIILTDSGGIQEEAPSFGVPVLLMREKTERPEGIEAGVTRLVGTGRARIVEEAARLLSDPAARVAMRCDVNPYGDGQAAARIVAALLGGRGTTDGGRWTMDGGR